MTAWADRRRSRLLLLVLILAGGGRGPTRRRHRLDRLHVRYDLSWHSLDAALARRAVVARAVAADAYGAGERCRRLTALADAAERAPRSAAGDSGERAVGGAGDGRHRRAAVRR